MSVKGVNEDQLKDAFNQFDKDDSGFISRQELLDVFRVLADKGQINADDDECKASTKAIMDQCNAAGTDDDKISFDEFKTVFYA